MLSKYHFATVSWQTAIDRLFMGEKTPGCHLRRNGNDSPRRDGDLAVPGLYDARDACSCEWLGMCRRTSEGAEWLNTEKARDGGFVVICGRNFHFKACTQMVTSKCKQLEVRSLLGSWGMDTVMKSAFLGGGLLFWRCSGVYVSKLVSVPRDIWDNDSGQSNCSAEAGGELQHRVHRGLGLSLQK